MNKELEPHKDELTDWANGQFHSWFDLTNQDDVIGAYRKVIAWVQNQEQFTDAAKAEFADGADGWVIAYAKAKGCVVVTQEGSHPDARATIFIPDVCEAFSIECIDTFKMLRDMGVKLTEWAILR